MTRTVFTQKEFDDTITEMVLESLKSESTKCRIVAHELHHYVVGGSAPNRMPIACAAMWKMAAGLNHTVISQTPSGFSSSLEIEYDLNIVARILKMAIEDRRIEES